MIRNAVLDRARFIYQASKKRNDNVWTEWITRPLAAVVVQLLESSSVTPNQISFTSFACFVIAAVILICWPGWLGLVAGVAVTQFSYVLDAVDGQLARLKKQTSPAGALLDFVLDEIKALMLVAAASVRLWYERDDATFLVLGVGGVVVVAAAISFTTFTRTPVYREAAKLPPILPATDRAGFLPAHITFVGLLEAAGRYVLHYPSWLVFIAVANRLDLFLYIYLGMQTLYVARVMLGVVMKLGGTVNTGEI